MSPFALAPCILALVLGADRASSPATTSSHERAPAVRKAAHRLSAGESVAVDGTAAVQRAALEGAMRDAAHTLGPHSVSAERLLDALDRMSRLALDDDDTLRILRGACSEILGDLRFRPFEEAERPEGFPDFTPVGEIEVKAYPVYRLARTEMAGRGPLSGGAFWTLFHHIKKHDIAMTSPVQMDYRADGNGKPVEGSMAFLYGSTSLGSEGREGRIEVLDAPAGLVVTLGMRGNKTEARVLDARKRLERWLDAHRERYESSGELRTMEYNSPFVPADRRYFEVQIPVKPVAATRSI